MKAKNAFTNHGSITGAVNVGDQTHVRVVKPARRAASYPDGCIGANLPRRNYVKYLVERYNHYREADPRFGRTGRFHYSVLFKNIETKFKAPTYFIPENRFEELVDYLHRRIDNTILGRLNRRRGIRSYESFDEYVMEHMGTAVVA
ncbi:MAG TPA: hypothetical protein VMF08_00385 [Candidatus Sulfotelmatobacter sp.]|nr:hypothetical protein [Candidatus Sulfotelmatobacter sp.]